MLKPLGDSAILIQLGDEIHPTLNARVHALDALLQFIPDIVETVPAYCTVLVHYDPLRSTYNQIKNLIEEKISLLDESTHRPSRRLEIPVLYGGASGVDFESVATTLALSPSELIHLHSEREYTVYMMGFTPGFPYMGILDERLVLPRMSTPRTRVPAGSVAIAGSQTGIYPLDSPGGWHVIGWTPLKLFDPMSENPFLFAPGDIVKFIPMESGSLLRPQRLAVGIQSNMLEIIDLTGIATLQDLGRRGWNKFGVPTSGPMDWFAYQAANSLLDNPPNSATIELGLGEITLHVLRNTVISVTGAGYEVENYIWTFPLWTSFYVRAGWTVRVKKTSGGNWAYIAIAGGFDSPIIMNSRSTYLHGGIGSALKAGDVLHSFAPTTDLLKLAARSFLL